MAVLTISEPISLVETVGGGDLWSSNLISTRLSNSLFPWDHPQCAVWDYPVSDEDGLRFWGEGHVFLISDLPHGDLGKSWKVFSFPQWWVSSSKATRDSSSDNKLRTKRFWSKPSASLKTSVPSVSLCVCYTLGSSGLYLQHGSQVIKEMLLSCLLSVSYKKGGSNTFQALHKSELNM